MGSRRRRSPHEFTGRVYSAPTRMTGYRVHAFLARIRRTRLVNDARRDDPAPCDVHTRRTSTRSSDVTPSTSVSGVARPTTAPRSRAKTSSRRNERARARASREPDPSSVPWHVRPSLSRPLWYEVDVASALERARGVRRERRRADSVRRGINRISSPHTSSERLLIRDHLDHARAIHSLQLSL